MPHHLFEGALSSLLLNTVCAATRTVELLSRSREALRNTYLKYGEMPAAGAKAAAAAVRRSRLQSAAAIFVPVLAVPMLTLMQPALLVTVEGQPVGYVDNAGAVSAAIAQIERRTASLLGGSYELDASIELTPIFATNDSLIAPEDTEEVMAEALPELASLALVTVNGEPAGLTDTAEEAEQVLDEIKSLYADSTADSVQFVEDVRVEPVVTDVSLMESGEALYADLTAEADGAPALSVAVTQAVTYTEDIPYATITVENSQLAQRTTEIVQAGENGEAEVTAELTLINGVEQERTIVSRTVLSEATNEIVEVGTKNMGFGTGELRVPVSSYNYTSGFGYRHGAYHRGVDLCTAKGSNIYAADNGRVIVAEYHYSYGWYVVIDHRNGMETLYAHNSELCVSVGDIVAKGDVIAKAGCTGDSTANHCHFEVHIDGTAVNPEKYLDF